MMKIEVPNDKYLMACMAQTARLAVGSYARAVLSFAEDDIDRENMERALNMCREGLRRLEGLYDYQIRMKGLDEQ